MLRKETRTVHRTKARTFTVAAMLCPWPEQPGRSHLRTISKPTILS